MEAGRRNEADEKEEERHAGVGEEGHELASGRSVACSKVGERAQLLEEGSAGVIQEHSCIRLQGARSASQAKESKSYPAENGKPLKDSVSSCRLGHSLDYTEYNTTELP